MLGRVGYLAMIATALTANLIVAPSATAAAQTLEVGKPLARFALLTPSNRVYLRYRIIGDQRQTMDLWRRQVSFEEHNGQRQMHIFWRWDSVGDQKFSRSEDFWFEPRTFRPLTVERRLTRDGKTIVAGYRFLPDRIVGMAELPDNSRKDFLQLAKVTPYNFETDMELFQALPLALAYQVRVPFYEAGQGQDEPQYYTYKVVGEGKIAAADAHMIDCWIVSIDSSDPEWGTTRFWFAKKTQVMMREQTDLKGGVRLVKMLLTSDTVNNG